MPSDFETCAFSEDSAHLVTVGGAIGLLGHEEAQLLRIEAEDLPKQRLCRQRGRGGREGGQAAGEQGLARARRADHKQVGSAAGGDFKGALGVVLTADFRKVDRVTAVFPKNVIDVEFIGTLAHISCQNFHRFL